MTSDADIMGAHPVETDERMVFTVPSDSRAGRSYRVDALANDGGMRCSCTDFATRRQPKIDAGEETLTTQTTCKHCRKVVWYFCRHLFKRMAQAEEEGG